MFKILKTDAFETVVRFMDDNDYKSANEAMEIITRSIEQDRKKNIFSEFIYIDQKETKYFDKNILQTIIERTV